MEHEKWITGFAVLAVSVGLSGCASYSPDMGSLNPFGGEEKQQREEQSTGPLVMPGELKDEQKDQEQADGKRIQPEEKQDTSKQKDSEPIDFGQTRTADAGSSEQASSGSSSAIIKPSLTDSKRAAQLADEAHEAHKQGNIREAIEKFKQASRMDPSKAEYLINLGSLHFNQQNYGNAKNYYEKALSMNPDDAELNVYLGATHLRMGETNLAKQRLRKALELDPGNRTAQNLLDQIE